jgi:PEP-CTERM motif
MRSLTKFVWAALAVCALSGNASAATITFESHGTDFNPVQFQDGFTFSFNAEGWGIAENSVIGGGAPWTSNGTTRLLANGDSSGATAFVDIFRTDLADFSIGGFDAATMFPRVVGRIEVIPSYGGVAGTSLFIDLTDTFATYALPGFNGVSGIRVRDTFAGVFLQTPGFSLDNLEIDPVATAVPEPGTLSLLGIGLAGYLRKRRRS